MIKDLRQVTRFEPRDNSLNEPHPSKAFVRPELFKLQCENARLREELERQQKRQRGKQ